MCQHPHTRQLHDHKPPPKRTAGQNQLPFQSTEQLVYEAPVFDKGPHYSDWLLPRCCCVFTFSPLNDVVYSQISTFVRGCYCVCFTNLYRRPLFVVYNSQHSLSPICCRRVFTKLCFRLFPSLISSCDGHMRLKGSSGQTDGVGNPLPAA